MWQAVDIGLRVLALLLVVFATVNVVCWLVIRRWPNLLLSENERLSIDYLARFGGEFRAFIPEWFDLEPGQWDDFSRELKTMISRGGHTYAPFVEMRHPPYSGRLYNFHEAGFRYVRNQGPWPVSPEYFNIFFFGGSTTVHVGPDWTSVPSRLQEELNARIGHGRPVRVYNFGCGSYFSTQERILFQQQLLDKAMPEMVVFLDGVNDFYFFDGRPSIAGFFKHALDTHNRENDEARRSKIAADPKFKRLSEFLWSLPLNRLIEAVGEAQAKRTASASDLLYRPIEVDPETLVPAMERYLENKRQIEALCREYGIRAVFVLQPTPAYKYDLRYHAALSRHYGLGGHERSGVGYGLLAERLATQPAGSNFLWLADMQEHEQEPLYLDNMHYTAKFSHTIASHIADHIVRLGSSPAMATDRPLERVGPTMHSTRGHRDAAT
jgi:hypothetical protein